MGSVRNDDTNSNRRVITEDDDITAAAQYNKERRYTRQTVRPGSEPIHQQFVFKEFSPDSLNKIRKRKLSLKAKRYSVAQVDSSRQKLEPDPSLASGQQLPPYIIRQIPPELKGKPIEDIDPYYADKEVSNNEECD